MLLDILVLALLGKFILFMGWLALQSIGIMLMILFFASIGGCAMLIGG